MKEFTVFPPKKKKTVKDKSDVNHDVLLLLREDGNFVQYMSGKDVGEDSDDDDDKEVEKNTSSSLNVVDDVVEGTSDLGTMKGSWALVDGQLILAADRPKQDDKNIRSGSSTHDTMMAGKVVATSGQLLKGNPALAKAGEEGASAGKSAVEEDEKKTNAGDQETEDVHLSVSGEISIGKFFYPLKHPSFFDQPMFGPTPTGSFELKQVLGTLNTQVGDGAGKLVEKFRKRDIMDKRFFLTSYPLPTRAERLQKKMSSEKYNKYKDYKSMTNADKEREEMEKNAPMQIKSFEVALFANNTFSTITGLGDTVLRGKWSIIGEERDQLWMNVWRFGFGRSVSGSTYSEGPYLSHFDDVSYWGKIYEVDAAVGEDSIEDDPAEWKGTRIEINGAVMIGVGLEPCSIARFTMIEKTEDDDDIDEDDEDDEDDETRSRLDDLFSQSSSTKEQDDNENEDLGDLPFDVGSFE